MSLMAALRAAVELEHDPRQPQQLELAAERPLDPGLDVGGLHRRQEPDRAVVDREDRYRCAGVTLERPQDRAVAAEHHAQLDVIGGGCVDLNGRPGLELVLRRLLLVESQRHAALRGALDQQVQCGPCVLRPAVGVDGRLPHGSTSRASRIEIGYPAPASAPDP